MHDTIDWQTPIAVKSVGAILDETVRLFPDRPGLDFLGRRTTYGELGRLVDFAARGFQQLGVRKGVKVGICLPNTPYFVICYYAVLKAGGTVVNFNPLYVEREIAHQIEDSGTTIMVTLDLRQIYPKVAAMLDTTCLEKVVICPMADVLPAVQGLLFQVLKRSELADVPAEDLRHVTFARLIANDGRLKPVEIDPKTDIAVLQYTGGTTGLPKGAVLTHANITANTEQLSRWVPEIERGQERMLCVLPLFHVFAMTVGMNLGIAFGAELILLPRFDLEQVVKCIARKRPTLFPGVPTIYTAINGAAEKGGWDLSSIRCCISGGAPLPIEVRSRFEQLTGCFLVEGYGLSEASPVVTCNPFRAVKAGSVGVPLPGTTVEIRAPHDPTEVLAQGEKGEICVRGPQVMAGYWQRPVDTEQIFIDGALRTGDIGYVDEDGYLFLVDRIKDVIISGGYNIYPRVIEEALYQHPSVAEAVVIAVPDPYRGQAPKAFVRLRDGQKTTPEELRQFLAGYISRIELPKAIEIRDVLPKTMVGKLSKKELVAEEEAKAAAGGSLDKAS
ncbi:long-chain fatty acid--CoA ligase [Telmatospirillum sp.]|uniref:long-chain-fatty-acid--CoA ligase n=1 Tax=Telmatospirillum sp. TaxID=2079197 RepID=UPI0028460DED|nr:long-chain fatty acid--CoA ligase [Telmatospirillum sp.]MDR3436134.1 long-chain fatty acid--CoA ligase [Telmatospirillum sp.]